MADVSRRSRATYAAYRYVEHFTGLRPDDTSLQRRIRREMHRFPANRISSVDRVLHLTPEQFLDGYLRPGRPVVIEGMARDWPCVRQWTPAWLREQYGRQQVAVCDTDVHGGRFNLEEMALGDYLTRVEAGDSRKYLRVSNLLHLIPELKGHLDVDTLRTYMNRVALPPNFGAFIGAAGTWTALHAEPFDNLFTQVFGTKRWTLIPARFDPVLRPVVAGAPYFWTDFDPKTPDDPQFPAARHVDRYEVEVQAGDVLYVPPSFWHQVENPTTSIGVGFKWIGSSALRRNFSQVLLLLTARKPSLRFMFRNRKDFPAVMREVERHLHP